MRTLILATLLTLLSFNTYADVKVNSDDSIYLSSNHVYVKSPSGKSVKIIHNCDLDINPQSTPIVKNNGRKISKNSVLTIIVDEDKQSCKVKQIAIV